MEGVKKALNEFARKYNLEEEAKKGCLISMQNCITDFGEEGLGGFSIDEIRLEFIRHELIFEHYFRHTPFIKTRIGIYKKEENDSYFRNLELIGTYDLDTYMNGESFDDWLSIDEEKNNQLRFEDQLKEINDLLPEKYLKTDSAYYEYIFHFSNAILFYQSKKYFDCQVFMKYTFEFVENNKLDDKIQNYVKKSKKLIQLIATYMRQCGLIEKKMMEEFEELGILKRKKK